MASALGDRRIELPYLDGIRGAAAIIVVLFHAFLNTGATGDADAAMPLWGKLIGLGYLGVAVFIVLSGYVLMLPIARADGLRLRSGARDFFTRRARRILPPYFAALIFSLLLIAAVPLLQQPSGTQWDSKVPVDFFDIASHFLLLHDLSPDWIGSINGPLWSVAVEWQIYFLMPLLLLPLWRRIPGALVVALVCAATLLLAQTHIAEHVHPWFLALFAGGMLGAQLTVRDRLPSGFRAAGILLAAAAVAALVADALLDLGTAAWAETATGLLFGWVLAWAGWRELHGQPVTAMRVFATKPMLALGLISYSIYLFHSPLLALANLLLRPLALPTVVLYLVLTFVAAPLAVLVSWSMFHLVERRFLNTRQRSSERQLAGGTHVAASDSERADDARVADHEPVGRAVR